jgi:hypothetical protein
VPLRAVAVLALACTSTPGWSFAGIWTGFRRCPSPSPSQVGCWLGRHRKSECYSWPGKSHLGDWANNDASAVHRHPLEMMVISAQALRGTCHPVVALEAQTQVAEQSTRSCSRRRKCWVPECPPSRDSAPSHDGTPGAFPTVARKAPSLD